MGEGVKMEKVVGLLNKGAATSPMELWEKSINENKNKNEERQGIMDRGQRTAKSDAENRVGSEECRTCAARRYMDRSNDGSVSFQTPTHVSPEQSFAAVRGHEQEHVTNEKTRAGKESREVVQSSVTIHYAICPECGRPYAAGGETKTVTKSADKEQEPQEPETGDLRGKGPDGQRVNTKA